MHYAHSDGMGWIGAPCIHSRRSRICIKQVRTLHLYGMAWINLCMDALRMWQSLEAIVAAGTLLWIRPNNRLRQSHIMEGGILYALSLIHI